MTIPAYDQIIRYVLLLLWVITEIHGINIGSVIEQTLAGLGIVGTIILLLVDHARGQGVFR
jgi:hypothetical protein